MIQPGQEGFISDLLDNEGKPYPADCVFDGASIEKSGVAATFTCAGKKVPLELRHPDAVKAPDARTRQFAIIAPTAPRPLLDSLATRIASRESNFRWTILNGGPDKAVAPPRRVRLVVPFAIAAALLVLASALLSRLRRK